MQKGGKEIADDLKGRKESSYYAGKERRKGEARIKRGKTSTSRKEKKKRCCIVLGGGGSLRLLFNRRKRRKSPAREKKWHSLGKKGERGKPTKPEGTEKGKQEQICQRETSSEVFLLSEGANLEKEEGKSPIS